MSDDATPSGEEQHDNQQTDQSKPMYEGQCENCGVIDFGNDHPDGDYGPECPGCGAVLRAVVEVDDPEDMREDVIDADSLEEAHETLSMLDAEFDPADAARKSEMILEQV